MRWTTVGLLSLCLISLPAMSTAGEAWDTWEAPTTGDPQMDALLDQLDPSEAQRLAATVTVAPGQVAQAHLDADAGKLEVTAGPLGTAQEERPDPNCLNALPGATAWVDDETELEIYGYPAYERDCHRAIFLSAVDGFTLATAGLGNGTLVAFDTDLSFQVVEGWVVIRCGPAGATSHLLGAGTPYLCFALRSGLAPGQWDHWTAANLNEHVLGLTYTAVHEG